MYATRLRRPYHESASPDDADGALAVVSCLERNRQ
ncbi:hypothetical protein BIFADO_00749 [Bifidobacterium adolescentis L2-32]|uniref:Uncharacterized protein n=1 Tax=Bifidobacterium adolescentis L2-32 TaxID=411481 RepID=A7A4J1_BIFAD|nr:hypothetical protein BIFADO_00749 [Bifidobacterium adolescentis L2-32]